MKDSHKPTHQMNHSRVDARLTHEGFAVGQTWSYYNVDDPTESTGMVIEFYTILSKATDPVYAPSCDRCGRKKCRCWHVLITSAASGRMWIRKQQFPAAPHLASGYRRLT